MYLLIGFASNKNILDRLLYLCLVLVYVNYKTNIVLHEKKYVKLMIYNRHDPYQFLLNDLSIIDQFKKKISLHFKHYV